MPNTADRRAAVAELTEDEMAIYRLLVKGYEVGDISRELGMNRNLINSKRKDTREYLGVFTDVAAIVYMIRSGVLPLPEVGELRAEIELV